jgi:hypothetical protein
MRWRRPATVAFAGLILAATGLSADGGPARPALAFADGVPSDVRALAHATWERFIDAFAGRRACLAPVTVASAWSLDDRAAYDPGGRLVTIRIPGTAPNLAASLVHEFAHHLEFTCPEHRTLRASFRSVQGLDADAPWRTAETWSEIPSEQFAEATVRFVLGRAPAHRMAPVERKAVAVIRAWAAGDRLTHRRAAP